MDALILFWKLLPFLALVAVGVYSILEVCFPSLRDPDFNRWQVSDANESSITILGWKKVLKPARVIAQGYMSDRAACAIALSVGFLLIGVGFFGIRHIAGIPENFPDLFGGFSH